MSETEKKPTRWDTLAQELGADATPMPNRPVAPAAPVPPAPPPQPAAEVTPVEKPRRSGWDDLTSWLGIGGAKRARPEAAAPPAAATPEPPTVVSEPRPRRESAFRTEQRTVEQRSSEPRPAQQAPRREPEAPRREPGPALGSRGREFDDFRDALQEERDVLEQVAPASLDEGTPRRADARDESPRDDDGGQRRRRRRRGGRGRGRGRSEGGESAERDHGRIDQSRREEGESEQARRARPADHQDYADVDEDFAAREPHGFEEVAGRDDVESFDYGVSSDRPRAGDDRSGDEAQRKRRRRRRRGGRGRDGGRSTEGDRGEPSSAAPLAGVDDEHDHDDELAESGAGRDRRIIHDSDDHDDHGDHGDVHADADHDSGEDFHQIHKGIPTWDEAVGHVIGANMESRVRNPGGGHGGHRGGRGRGGRDRH